MSFMTRYKHTEYKEYKGSPREQEKETIQDLQTFVTTTIHFSLSGVNLISSLNLSLMERLIKENAFSFDFLIN